MTGLEGSAVKVLQAIAPSSLCFILGVPLVGGLYGQQFVDLVVQGSVIQSIVYFPVVTIVLEYRSVTDSSVNATEIEDSEGNLQLDVEKAVVTIPQRGYKLTETKQIIQDLISPISNAAILTNMFAIGK
ncbi:hypothetical protein E3N88_01313 [Mikania micrantha]|uniref:Uncharacterized protein n=1 Tax=Mikania micrantha TaxID=192012 RepID=A0A5N6Q236_9ASTR|nr:hypothetical protein E3N88_01313 [Mikania micrantha]